MQHGGDVGGDHRQHRRLDGDDDDVLGLQVAGPVGDHRVRHQQLVAGLHLQPVVADRVELLAALDDGDRCPAVGEPAGDVAAYGARAVHTDLHDVAALPGTLVAQANCSRFWAAAALRKVMSLPVET